MSRASSKTKERLDDDEALRQLLAAQDELVALLRLGYGPGREKIERARERLASLRDAYPDVYAHAEEIRKKERS